MTREEQIFEEVAALPKPERAARLTALCGADAAISERVSALLAASDSAASFLETPAAGVGREAAAGGIDNLIGRRIGRYKLLQGIGEGGCGVVYMAEQEEPVHRRVALKIIKLGMDTKVVIARFEAERQALSMMEHPNIARVLDVGATEQGRPYFVMELVRGVRITRYCDEHNLSTRQRLELFLDVCSAVQHAHQKGVIHRDLKPSNILVTLHDGAPVPKVIDFGVAKATHGRLTNQTLFTAFEQFIGTPAYMSPEQAELSGLDIDTRSDIYSLGVLLYELLSGCPPFDPKTFSTAGLDEIRRVIREVEPPTPSLRLSTQTEADRTMIARARAIAPAHLASVLRGDLDWIVMKALDKNRARRYDTANGLAMDIRRFLRNEPVIARPPSTAYLLQKLVLRHRLAFAAGGIVLLSLVAGLAGVSAQLRTEKQSRESAEKTTDATINAIQEIGRSAASKDDPASARTLFDQFVAMAETLAERPMEKARLLDAVGRAEFNIGDVARAREIFGQVLNLHRSLPDKSDHDIARSLNNLALAFSAIVTQERSQRMQAAPADPIRRLEGSLKDAERDLRTAIEIQQRLPSSAIDLARSQSNLGWIIGQQGGRHPEAETELKRAIEAQRNLASKLDLALSHRRIALIQIHQNRLDEALENLREALGADTEAFQGIEHLEIASDYNFRAIAFAILDNGTDKLIGSAIDSYYKAIEIREKLRAAPSIGNTGAGESATTNLSRQGTIDEVTSLVAETREYALERGTPGDRWKESYFLAIPAFVFIAERKFEQAADFAKKCYDMRRLLDPNDYRTYNVEGMLGLALAGQGRPELLREAEVHLQNSYEGLKRLGPDLPREHQIWRGFSLANLMVFKAGTGKLEDAVQILLEYKAWEQNAPVDTAIINTVRHGPRVAEVREKLERAVR